MLSSVIGNRSADHLYVHLVPKVKDCGEYRVNGDEHGELAHIVRSIQKANYEIPYAKRHEQDLLAGHFGIGVTS
jgi:hypothetical protein